MVQGTHISLKSLIIEDRFWMLISHMSLLIWYVPFLLHKNSTHTSFYAHELIA